MVGRLIGVIATCSVVALLGACAGDDGPGGPESGGAPADSIVLYTGRNTELVGPLVRQFSEETGIAVEVREGGSAELASQLLIEGDASPADVFLAQDAGALGAVSRAGLFSELPESITSRVPQGFRAADASWVGTSGRARVVVYNPDLIEDPPGQIDSLLKDEYRGRIGFAPSNASFQSFVTALRVLRGDDGAREWLESCAAQEPVAYEGNSAVRDAVDAGEVDLGLVNHYYLYEAIAERGEGEVTAANRFMDPGDPGGLVNVAGAGVLASSDAREAAMSLVGYLVGDAGQRYFAGETFEYPVVEGIPADAALPPLDELDPPALDLGDLDSLEETQRMLADVGLLTM